MALVIKNPPAKAGDKSSIPGSGLTLWRSAWQRTPVFLPGEFHGQRSLVDYCPWGWKESDRLKQLSTHSLCKVTVIQKYFVSHTKKFIDFIPEIWIKQNIYTDKVNSIPGYLFIALEGKLLRREMKNKSFLQKDSLFNNWIAFTVLHLIFVLYIKNNCKVSRNSPLIFW